MNIKNQTNQEVYSHLKSLRGSEKELLAELLKYLKETESRKIHLERGFSSLYVFCTDELGYSKDEAYLRIQAVRLMQSLQEVEEKILKGSLCLSSAAKMQTAFKRVNEVRKKQKEAVLSFQEKKETLQAIEGQSSRECEKTLAGLFPQAEMIPEKTKALSQNRTLIQFTASNEALEVYEELKGLLAHKNYEGRWEEFFFEIAKIALKQISSKRESPKLNKASKSNERKLKTTQNENSMEARFQAKATQKESELMIKEKPESSTEILTKKLVEKPPETAGALVAQRGAGRQKPAPQRRYISIHIKRAVWAHAHLGCAYIDPVTGKKCGGKYALEIDHVRPLALGGADEIANLRLLCSQHNKFLGWKVFERPR